MNGKPDRRPPPDYQDFSHRQILLILSGLRTGPLLSSLDQTVTATSIQTIANYFHDYSLLVWQPPPTWLLRPPRSATIAINGAQQAFPPALSDGHREILAALKDPGATH